jgi:hypothetical protein
MGEKKNIFFSSSLSFAFTQQDEKKKSIFKNLKKHTIIYKNKQKKIFFK